jgi:hypothetical protein
MKKLNAKINIFSCRICLMNGQVISLKEQRIFFWSNYVSASRNGFLNKYDYVAIYFQRYWNLKKLLLKIFILN